MSAYAAVPSVVCRGGEGRPGRRHPRCSRWALTACSPARCADIEDEGGVDSDELGRLAYRQAPGLVAVSLENASRNVARPRLLASGRTVGGNADGIGHCVLVRNVGHQGTPLRRAGCLLRARDLAFGGRRESNVLAAGSTSTGAARSARRSIPVTDGRLTEDMP